MEMQKTQAFHASGNASQEHSAERLFHCSICSKSFKTRGVLSGHEKSHKNDDRRKDTSCNICKIKFRFPSLLKKHMIIHTQEKTLICEVCGMQFRFKKSLQSHKRIHSNERPFACNKCNKSFKFKEYLSRHEETHKTVDQGKGVSCNICKRKLGNPFLLKQHMIIHEKPIESSLQEQIQLKMDLLKHPMSFNDRHVGGISRSGNFCNEDTSECEVSRFENTTETIPRQCHTEDRSSKPVIGKRVSVAAGVVYDDEVSSEVSQSPIVTQMLLSSDHSETAKDVSVLCTNNDRGASSTFCSQKDSTETLQFPPGSTLLGQRGIYHMKDKEKPFGCGYCGKTYKSNRALYSHISLQHEKRGFQYSCEFCGKQFSLSSYLAQHVRIHTPEKPFTCDECGKQFRFDGSLRRHKFTHSEERLFHCSICSKSFKTRGVLSGHEKSHKNDDRRKDTSCNICKIKFRFPSLLKKHMIIHTQEKPFTCDECGKQFRFNNRLLRHKFTHSNERPFTCNKCNKSFKFSDHLSRHAESHKKEDQRKGVCCPICNRKLGNPFLLKQHMIIHEKPIESSLQEQIQLKMDLLKHPMSSNDGHVCGISRSGNFCNEDTSECEVSRFENTTETIPRQCHTEDRSSKPVIGERVSVAAGVVYDDEVSSEVSQSPIVTQMLLSSDHSEAAKDVSVLCTSRQANNDRGESSTFGSQKDSTETLQFPPGSTLLGQRGIYHMKDKEKPFGCGYCGKTYKSNRALYSHISLQHEKRSFQYSCEFCGKHFSLSSYLAQHVRIHTPEKPFTCDECGKQFRFDGSLRRHKFTHSAERLFHCSICSKSFKTRGVLSGHEKSHKNDDRRKDTSCNICKIKFRFPSLLKKHMIIHTQEKTLICEVCGMQFRFKKSLQSHKRIHSNEKPFACNKCNKSFKFGKYLSRHEETHKTVDQGKGVSCNICKRKLGNPFLLKQHMIIHEKPIESSLQEQIQLKMDLLKHPMSFNDQHVGGISRSGNFCNEDTSECEVSRFKNTTETLPRQCHTEDRSSKPVIGKQVSVAAGVVYDDEVSSEVSQSPTVTQMLLSSDHSEAATDVSVLCTNNDRGASSTFCSQKDSKETLQFPPGSTLLGKRGIYHMKDKEKPFGCGYCGKTYKSNRALYSHISLQHEKRSFQYSCEFCGKHFSLSSYLAQHVRIHTPEKPFTCDECGKQFRFDGSLRRHKFTHSAERLFHCSICSKSFKTRGVLSGHEKSHKNDDRRKDTSCNICKIKFRFPSLLKKHMIIHTQEKPLICETCGMQFRFKRNLQSHKRTHSNEKPFACNKCNKSFKFGKYLSRHEETHKKVDQRKGLSCNICKRKFRIPSLLKEHMMIHTGEKPFKCTLCDKQYRLKIILQKHMNTHNGKKSIPDKTCPVCGKTFGVNYISLHMRVHSGEKPFECNICGKKFPRRSYLEGHIRSHTGEKPFACNGCDKRFALYCNMVTHKAKCTMLSANVV